MLTIFLNWNVLQNSCSSKFHNIHRKTPVKCLRTALFKEHFRRLLVKFGNKEKIKTISNEVEENLNYAWQNSVHCKIESVSVLGPRIWTSAPPGYKLAANLHRFQKITEKAYLRTTSVAYVNHTINSLILSILMDRG